MHRHTHPQICFYQSPNNTYISLVLCNFALKYSGIKPSDTRTHLSAMSVIDAVYGRVDLIQIHHVEAVLHVWSPALDRIHTNSVLAELPRRTVQPSTRLVRTDTKRKRQRPSTTPNDDPQSGSEIVHHLPHHANLYQINQADERNQRRDLRRGQTPYQMYQVRQRPHSDAFLPNVNRTLQLIYTIIEFNYKDSCHVTTQHTTEYLNQPNINNSDAQRG